MALPSQGGFTSIRGRNMYRKKRKRSWFSWIVCIGAAGAITWLLWPDGEFADTAIVEEIVENRLTPVVAMSEDQFAQTPQRSENHANNLTETDPHILPVVKTISHNDNANEELETDYSLQPIPLTKTTSSSLETGLSLLDNNQIIEARRSLSESLLSGELSESEQSQARAVLTDISDRLVFSPEMSQEDPFALEYVIRSGDTLSEIVNKMNIQVDWRFIQRINRISTATSIRPGQPIKLITGPFHAEIDKAAYRMDFYLGEGNDRVFVRSYPVGLGEYNSTPLGSFVVRPDSKLINPKWVNPRTRASFAADNPANPIGERWIGLKGIEERTRDLGGLGIHGTIEPESIGTDASMGCVRMLKNDVAQVYEMLTEGVSTVKIHE